MVINEVAWAGTAANAADEWLELYNAGDSPVALDGWALSEGETPIIALSGTIAPGAFYLIERTDDSATAVVADLYGPFGGNGLSNGGERLLLKAADGGIVDEVPCTGGWFAGDGATKATMERVDPLAPGTSPSNWASNDGVTTVGSDAAGGRILGTPAYRNSVSSFR